MHREEYRSRVRRFQDLITSVNPAWYYNSGATRKSMTTTAPPNVPKLWRLQANQPAVTPHNSYPANAALGWIHERGGPTNATIAPARARPGSTAAERDPCPTSRARSERNLCGDAHLDDAVDNRAAGLRSFGRPPDHHDRSAANTTSVKGQAATVYPACPRHRLHGQRISAWAGPAGRSNTIVPAIGRKPAPDRGHRRHV
jgi:hypothetical protein